MNLNGYKLEYSINPTSIHGKIRGDSQYSPCKQQRTQPTMLWLKFSGRNGTANVAYFIPYEGGVTAALRCRIHGNLRPAPVTIPSAPVSVPRRALRPFHLRPDTVRFKLHYGRHIPPWSAEYGCHGFYDLCTSF